MKEQVTSLTIHGISNVFTAEWWLPRVVWLIFVVSLVILLTFTFSWSYRRYNSFEVYERVEIKTRKVLPLPALTFCHTDFYNPQTYVYSAPPVFQHFPENCSLSGREYFKNEVNKYIFDLFCYVFMGTFKAQSSAIGYFLPQYFQFPKGFTLLPQTHPCTTLNRNSTLVQTTSGENNGLHMIMYYPKVNNSFFSYEVMSPLLDQRQGISVQLHDPKQHVPIQNRVLLPVGFHTHISVTKKSIKRLPSPYPSGCIQGLSDNDSIFPGKNTQEMCIASCIHKTLYSKCSGVLPEITVFFNPGLAGNMSYNDTMECLAREAQSPDTSKCACKPHCFDETYSYTTSRNPWPSMLQLSTLSKLVNKLEGVSNRSLTLEDLRERLFKVSISYATFKELAHEEVPVYDASSIAGDIGGQMGLCLGASLISLVEVFSLLVTCIWVRIFGKRKSPATIIANRDPVKN